nr:hypothetical protein [Bacilli bacterium]
MSNTIDIFIWGVSDYIKEFISSLNLSMMNIAALIDERQEWQNREVLGYSVVSPDHIFYQAEYLVLLRKIDKERILQHDRLKNLTVINVFDMLEFYKDFHFKMVENPAYHLNAQLRFAKRNDGQKILVTGSSYATRGINEGLFSRKAIKICNGSQDLYYDFRLSSNVLEGNSNYEYAIMGISYYCFEYDTSKSRTQGHLVDSTYYPVLKDRHHRPYSMPYSIPMNFQNFLSAIREGLPMANDHWDMEKYFDAIYGTWTLNPNEASSHVSINDIPNEWYAEKRAQQHSSNDYPDTRIEYQKIMKDYLELLKRKKIKPVMVIFPVHPLYRMNFDSKMIKRFYEIIDPISHQYDFQLIDGFAYSGVTKRDFLDGDHLNSEGAAKFTLYLEKEISW